MSPVSLFGHYYCAFLIPLISEVAFQQVHVDTGDFGRICGVRKLEFPPNLIATLGGRGENAIQKSNRSVGNELPAKSLST